MFMKMKFLLLIFLSTISALSYSQVRYFKGTLSGSQQVPPVLSQGRGTIIVRYDMASNIITLRGDYQNLTSTIVGSHIHAAPAGSNGPIIDDIDNTGDTTGALNGFTHLSDSLEGELLAGNMYVNVHSDSFPDGEIRAQLLSTTEGQTELLTGKLQGAQEVPPDTSMGSGSVAVLVDKATREVNVTGYFNRLTSAVTASHIHKAPVGVAGPIIMELLIAGDTTGTVTGTDTLSAADISAMDSGNTYVNVHSVLFPAGELRAQLFNKQQLLFFQGTLSGTKEVPPTTSNAHGVVIVKYDSTSNQLELYGDYQSLAAPAVGAHIHQAPRDSTGPIILPLTFAGDSTGSLRGTGILTDSQETELMAGNMYVNVHSTLYPEGEIRTQLHMTTSGLTDYITGTLSGSQQVPPTPVAGTGTVYALLDKGTDSVYVTGNYFGLTGPPTGAHIHQAPVGQTGPIIVELSATGVDTGAVSGSGILTSAQIEQMVQGNTYVNIHTDSFPAGEIRAQLADVLLPVKLLYFNAYKDQNKVKLLWASAQEINLSNYEIEQQNPVTKQWVTKATVIATNNANGSEYTYSDLPLNFNDNYVYYRLKMVDNDGKYSYSLVVRVNFNQGKAEIVIRPNPVINNQLQFTITGLSTDKKVSYLVSDLNGRISLTGTVSSLSNNTLNLSSLAPGMYKLVVRFDNTVLQQSFIK